MGLTAKEPESTGYSGGLAPAGTIQGVCCDVIDRGVEELTYAGETTYKHRCQFAFELDEIDEETDERFVVRSRPMTLSLHEKASLRKTLKSWLGRDIPEEKRRAGLDLEVMIGQNALLNIVHNEVGDRTYANIEGISPPLKGMAKIEVSGSYTRVKDRKTYTPPPTTEAEARQRAQEKNGGGNASVGVQDGDGVAGAEHPLRQGAMDADAALPF